MKRIIEKKTNLFVRDDFTYDEDIEFGLDVEPAQGIHKPKWSGEITEDEEGNITVGEGEWVEGATQEEIDELIKITGYIDGEYALDNKEMLIWTLALIRSNKNAIISLGGTI